MAGTPFSFAALLERPDIWRGDSLSRAGTPAVPSGFPELDAELPGGGWPAGTLTEILPAHEGIGELRLLGPALAALSNRGLRLAWIAPPHLPYAPALAAAGIDIAMLVVVRTASPIEAPWAAGHPLSCSGLRKSPASLPLRPCGSRWAPRRADSRCTCSSAVVLPSPALFCCRRYRLPCAAKIIMWTAIRLPRLPL